MLTAMLGIAVLAVVGFGVPLALSVQRLYRDDALLRLSEEATRAVVTVPVTFGPERDPPELPASSAGVDLALYDPSGRRLQGTGPDRADTAVLAALRDGAAQRDQAALVVAVPVGSQELVVAAVRAAVTPGEVTRRVRRTWAGMAVLGLAVLSVAGAVAARRSRSLARPLGRLRADAQLLGDGGEPPGRPPTGVSEIDDLAGALVLAADRLQAAMVRERSLSADLAHQLRTPLTSLRLRLETAQLQQPADWPLAAEALADVERLEQTITDLLDLARDTGRAREPQDVGLLVRQAAQQWSPVLERVGRRLELRLADRLPTVRVNPAAVRQILDVLLDNAVRHGVGRVTLSLTGLDGGVVLAVADEGVAVLEAEQVFARRRGAGGGTGIGLALAHRLAEAEGGRLVLPDPGPGPVFHLVLAGAGQRLGS